MLEVENCGVSRPRKYEGNNRLVCESGRRVLSPVQDPVQLELRGHFRAWMLPSLDAYCLVTVYSLTPAFQGPPLPWSGVRVSVRYFADGDKRRERERGKNARRRSGLPRRWAMAMVSLPASPKDLERCAGRGYHTTADQQHGQSLTQGLG